MLACSFCIGVAAFPAAVVDLQDSIDSDCWVGGRVQCTYHVFIALREKLFSISNIIAESPGK